MRFALLVSSIACLCIASPTEAEGGRRQRRQQQQRRALEGRTLLPNGSECSESSQCDSGCCVWNPIANEVCDDDKWYRDCMEEDYTFTEGSSDTCGDSSGDDDDRTVLTMSYNLYLILLASDGVQSLDDRASRIGEWFASVGDGYDIVALQEVWQSADTVRDGMIAAGYCHYIYDDRGTFGSGMAVYSKFEIEEHDFRGFQNACGGGDCAVDKGVVYARITKNGREVNIFNTHMMYSMANHDVRRRQYEVMRGFIDEKNIDSELVLLAGDYNEDKINTPLMYETMLVDLNAGEIPDDPNGSTPYSYDPEDNTLIDPNSAGAGATQQALDFVFYDRSTNTVPPGEGSVCRYLQPKDLAGDDLSDHYPASCEILDGPMPSVMSATSGTSQTLRMSPSSLFVFSIALGSLMTFMSS